MGPEALFPQRFASARLDRAAHTKPSESDLSVFDLGDFEEDDEPMVWDLFASEEEDTASIGGEHNGEGGDEGPEDFAEDVRFDQRHNEPTYPVHFVIQGLCMGAAVPLAFSARPPVAMPCESGGMRIQTWGGKPAPRLQVDGKPACVAHVKSPGVPIVQTLVAA